MRWVALLLCLLIACKKQEAEPDPAPVPATPSTGQSSTKVKEEPEAEGSGSAAGSTTTVGSTTAVTAPTDTEKKLFGGDGSPARRDERGRARGPGGPVYMGRGPECTDKIDHCLRDGVWFAVGAIQRGRMYRATPVFEFEKQWWTWREQEASDYVIVYQTKVVERSEELKVGSPVIWLVEEGKRKWLDSEHDALTSSRWVAGIIESVSGSSFTVGGWSGAISSDTARVIIQQKKAP
jgi:hypothetical protein